MSCLPDSGGCERHRTDPFIYRYNQLHGANYTHKECLDRKYRNTPQPEALYADEYGHEIVIERKSIIWPTDYAARHSNDHIIADLIASSVRDITSDLPLSLRMEPAGIMPRARLTEIARQISDAIRSSIDQLKGGQRISTSTPGARWSCSLDPTEHEEHGLPRYGLSITWTSRDEMLDAQNLPADLTRKIQQIFTATVSKFSGYSSAKGILLLEPHGSIKYTGLLWWSDVFSCIPVPPEISEVWHSMHDWITDTEQGWIFESLHDRR